MEKEKLPINLTLEIVQHREPNDRWFTITAILSWQDAIPEPFVQRTPAGMVTEDELDDYKETLLFIWGETFDIQEVKEENTKED
jgi:hypothetical protein